MGLDNPIHIVFVALVVLMVFGAKRLPELGRSLGSGMRGFKDALGGEHALGADGSGATPPRVAPQLPAPAPAPVPVPVPVPVPAAVASAVGQTHEQHAA